MTGSDELLPASPRQVTSAPAETNSAPAEAKSADSAQPAGKESAKLLATVLPNGPEGMNFIMIGALEASSTDTFEAVLGLLRSIAGRTDLRSLLSGVAPRSNGNGMQGHILTPGSDPGISTLILVRLTTGNHRLGALGVVSAETLDPSPAEMPFLERLASEFAYMTLHLKRVSRWRPSC